MTQHADVQVQPAPPATAVRDLVTVRLPADGVYLSVLRSVTATLAARQDFTLDDIGDLRIAVGEACAMLLPHAVPGSDLECEFELTAEAMRISVSVPTSDGALPARDTFAWTVLTALAGDVDSRVDAGSRVIVDLHKHRDDASGAA